MTTQGDDTGGPPEPTAIETTPPDDNLSAAARRKLEASKKRRASSSNQRFSRELLTVFSLLPYKTGHSPTPTVTMMDDEPSGTRTTHTIYDADNEQQVPLAPVGVGEEACSAGSYHLPPPSQGASQLSCGGDDPSPIRLSISTRLQVDKATNLVCVPSPVDSATLIANRVIAALREADVPMMDGDRARPIHIDIDASTHVRGRGNVVAGDDVGRDALRRRENVLLASLGNGSLHGDGHHHQARRRTRRRKKGSAEAVEDDDDDGDGDGGANGISSHSGNSERYVDADMGDPPSNGAHRVGKDDQRAQKRTKSDLRG